MRRLLVLAALAAALALPLAGAATLSAEMVVRGDAAFRGSAEGTFAWGGSLQDARLGPVLETAAFQANGSAQLLRYEALLLTQEPGSPTGAGRYVVPVDESGSPLGRVQGELWFTDPGPSFSLRLLPADGEAVRLPAAFTLQAPTSLEETLHTADDAQALVPAQGFFPRPGGALRDADLDLEGRWFPGRLVATDVVVHGLAADAVSTHWTLEGAQAPSLGGAHRRIAPIAVVDGWFRLDGPLAGAAWHHSIERVSGTLDGDLLLANAQGSGTLHGTALPGGIHLFQGIGPLAVEADYRGDGGRWDLAGDPTYVGVNAESVWGSRGAQATVAGAGLLALVLAALAGKLHELAGLVVGSARRLTKADPFRSPARQRILAAIHESQPVTVPALRQATGLSRTALAYHLRVMLAYDVLQTTLPAAGSRNRVYMVNSSSLVFPVHDAAAGAAADAPLASEALAVVQGHPERQWIYDAVRQAGRLDFAGLAERRAREGKARLPQSSASHHLGMLVECGALRMAWQDGRKVYAVGVDRDEARAEQYRRLLRQLQALDLVRALAAGQAVEPRGRAVRRLAELGLVEVGRGGVRLRPFLRDLAPRL